MNKMKKILAVTAGTIAALALAGCSNDATVVNHNITQDAENFKVDRRIVFVNGITDEYLLTIEGRCNIDDDGNQLEVICKTDNDTYKKSYLGLSDNVTYFAEQLEPSDVSEYHYQVIFKPEQIIPDIDLETSGDIEGDGN